MSEIMASTQGLFSDSCRAVAGERIRKQVEECKLLFTIHIVGEICINYNYLYSIIGYLNTNNKIEIRFNNQYIINIV